MRSVCYAAFVFILANALAVGAAEQSGIRQEAYIWQRNWNEPLLSSIAGNHSKFSRLVPLKTEVAWKGGQLQVVQVPLNYAHLRATGCNVGLAFRIGAFPGPFNSTGEPIDTLRRLARAMLKEATDNGLKISELQIDFDSAASRLAGYQIWIEALRKEVKPVPLVITTLPSWLDRSEFKSLVQATDGYILQVHSFERPKNIEAPFQLCDPKLARRAVGKASALGVLFRVALPTYGYMVAFDPEGKFLGLSAEGPSPQWGARAQVRDLRSNPSELAALVSDWTRNRPNNMQGVIWYRLPTSADVLNWAWPTMDAVMAGRIPHPQLQVIIQKKESELLDLVVENVGEADAELSKTISARWKNARLVACDGLRGFECVDTGNESVQFQSRQVPPSVLKPRERRVIGWLRFSKETEVQFEIQ